MVAKDPTTEARPDVLDRSGPRWALEAVVLLARLQLGSIFSIWLKWCFKGIFITKLVVRLKWPIMALVSQVGQSSEKISWLSLLGGRSGKLDLLELFGDL